MARKRKPKIEESPTVALPFKILIDNKEQLPYQFSDILSNSDNGNRPFEVQTERRHLNYLGDYSIDHVSDENRENLGPIPRIMIERKSLSDFFGSMADRKNFEERVCRLSEECEFSCVVVEAEWSQIFDSPPVYWKNGKKYQSDMSPTSIHRTVQSWTIEFQNVHWMFYPDRESAESATFWFLYRFWEKLKKHQTDRQRKTHNYEVYHDGMKANRHGIAVTDNPYPRAKHIGDDADWWFRGWLDMADIMSAKTKGRTKCSEPPNIPNNIFSSDYERGSK